MRRESGSELNKISSTSTTALTRYIFVNVIETDHGLTMNSFLFMLRHFTIECDVSLMFGASHSVFTVRSAILEHSRDNPT